MLSKKRLKQAITFVNEVVVEAREGIAAVWSRNLKAKIYSSAALGMIIGSALGAPEAFVFCVAAFVFCVIFLYMFMVAVTYVADTRE